MAKVSINEAIKHARKLAKAGERQQAIDLYERILRAVPSNERAKAELAKLAKSSNPLGFTAAVRASDSGWAPEVRALITAKKYHEATQRTKALLENHPDSASLWSTHGAALEGLGSIEAATKAFEKATELAPAEAMIKSNLARLYRRTGELEKAILVLEDIVALHPDLAKAHLMLGAVLKQANRIHDALPHYKKAVELVPNDASAQNNLGNLLQQCKLAQKAIPHFENAIKADPKFAVAYFNLGNALSTMENFEAAISAYKKALDLEPGMMEAWFNLGNTYFDTEAYDDCAACFEKVLSLKPTYFPARKKYALLLLEQSEIEDAQVHLQELLKDAPNDAELQHALGRTFNYQGDIARASASYLSSFQIDPSSTSAYMSLATMPTGSLSSKTIMALEELYGSITASLDEDKAAFLEADILRHKGNTEAAWNAYAKANALVFSKRQEEANHTRLKQHDTLDRIRKKTAPRAAHDEDMATSLFILAPSRSGKTTFERLLGTSRFVKRQFESKRFKATLSACRHKFGLPDTVALSDLTDDAQAEFLRVYGKFLTTPENRNSILTDTSPHRLFNAWDIADLIPNSYFIFIERDPIDTAVAIFQKKYRSGGNYYAYHPDTIWDHLTWYRKMQKVLAEQLGNRALIISYADLLAKPEAQLGHVEHMLGTRLECRIPADFTQGMSNPSEPYRGFFGAAMSGEAFRFLGLNDQL